MVKSTIGRSQEGSRGASPRRRKMTDDRGSEQGVSHAEVKLAIGVLDEAEKEMKSKKKTADKSRVARKYFRRLSKLVPGLAPWFVDYIKR
jgi:hypothetical protein